MRRHEIDAVIGVGRASVVLQTVDLTFVGLQRRLKAQPKLQ